jgi:hypothetical protein
LGLGLGGPWVAQAWRKGGPSVTQGRPKRRIAEVFYLQHKLENAGLGTEIAVSADIARNRKSKAMSWNNTDDTDQESVIRKSKFLPLICADDTDQK